MRVSDHTRVCDRLGIDEDSSECRKTKQVASAVKEHMKESPLGDAEVPYVWVKVRNDMSREDFEGTMWNLQEKRVLKFDFGKPIKEHWIAEELNIDDDEIYLPAPSGRVQFYRIRRGENFFKL